MTDFLFQDCEVEIANLENTLKQKDDEICAAEERCGHTVRLGEQRHQEIRTLQAQLVGVQDRAKDMLLSQGAEISRANIHVSELYAQLERIMTDAAASSLSSEEGDHEPNNIDYFAPLTNGDHMSKSVDRSEMPAEIMMPRSNSQFLVSAPLTDTDFPVSESLQNLSKAITQRQKSENGPESLESNGSSLPSLVDRITDVQGLVEKYRKMQQQNK